jgi:hypothetical protein
MPPKKTSSSKSVKAAVTKSVAKAGTSSKKAGRQVLGTGQKAVVKAKSAAKPVVRSAVEKAKTVKKKTEGFIQTVKDTVQDGIESAGKLVKKITPDALLPKSGKTKRK